MQKIQVKITHNYYIINIIMILHGLYKIIKI